MRINCPIYTYEPILATAGLIINTDDDGSFFDELLNEEEANTSEVSKLPTEELEQLLNEALENEDYDAEMDDVFLPDESFRPLLEPAKLIKKMADNFLNQVKTNCPNRYFILKRITQNAEFWEICVQKGFAIINDEMSFKKLLQCIEVSFVF